MPPIDLRITSPCHEDWQAMTPSESGRHCASCDKTVTDVTGMRGDEARAVLTDVDRRTRAGEQVCLRAHADRQGRLSLPGARRYLLTNGLAAVIAMAFAGCNGDGPAASASRSDPRSGQSEHSTRVPLAESQAENSRKPRENIDLTVEMRANEVDVENRSMGEIAVPDQEERPTLIMGGISPSRPAAPVHQDPPPEPAENALRSNRPVGDLRRA